jgi:hypothetical protein
MSKAAAAQDEDLLQHHFNALLDQRCEDRGAIAQELFERFWAMLDDDGNGSPFVTSHIEDFIQLLKNHFEIASLVIIDLREPHVVDYKSATKRRMLDGTAQRREESAAIRAKDQAYLAHQAPFFEEEKRVFQEFELYRAKLLLFHSGTIGEEQNDELKRRLDVFVEGGLGGSKDHGP